MWGESEGREPDAESGNADMARAAQAILTIHAKTGAPRIKLLIKLAFWQPRLRLCEHAQAIKAHTH